MPRLTRQESQQVTRQKIVQAAEKEILRQGIHAASIRDICNAAGYSLGAFYSNYENKDELLCEIVENQTKREFAVIEDIVAVTEGLDTAEVLQKISLWLRDMHKHSVLSSLSLEFEIYAKHNPQFKKAYTKNKRLWHEQIAKALSTLFTTRGLTPKVEPLQMAIGFSALWSGLAIESEISNIKSPDQVVLLFLQALLDSSPESNNPKRKKA